MFDKETLDFIIKDPYDEIIVEKLNKREAVFSVNVTQLGEY